MRPMGRVYGVGFGGFGLGRFRVLLQVCRQGEEALRLIDWVLKRMCGWICPAAVSAL